MEKQELLIHSPVRFFEKVSSSLKDGELGLVTAKKGLGKTSVLVQFGIDYLLNNKPLIHVSFDQQSSNVIAWYSSILAEITKKRAVNVEELNQEIIRNRTILNFNQETFTLPKVVKTLSALKESGINTASIVVDGLNLDKVLVEDLKYFADFIKKENMTAWFSFSTEVSTLAETLPCEKLDVFTTVTHIESGDKGIYLNILKNGSGKITLDTKTLLMSE